MMGRVKKRNGLLMKKASAKQPKKRVERRIDIRTVAEAAKVSVATVSRVMNNVPNVDSALSKRVWEAVSKLGYIPNNQARALVSGRSRLFGVIISDIS